MSRELLVRVQSFLKWFGDNVKFGDKQAFLDAHEAAAQLEAEIDEYVSERIKEGEGDGN